jgi:hypothetical protein
LSQLREQATPWPVCSPSPAVRARLSEQLCGGRYNSQVTGQKCDRPGKWNPRTRNSPFEFPAEKSNGIPRL